MERVRVTVVFRFMVSVRLSLSTHWRGGGGRYLSVTTLKYLSHFFPCEICAQGN